MAAPNLSAIPSNNLKLSPFCIPLPPEITIFAAVSSGLSDSDNSCLTKLTLPSKVSEESITSTVFSDSFLHGSKQVPLTVITLILSFDFSLHTAFPA